MTRRRVSRAGALRVVLGFCASALVLWLILRFIARNGGVPALGAFELSWALGAISLSTLQVAVVAQRWAFFARELGAPLDYPAALGAYYVSVFLNQLLPLGIVGDAARGMWHARRLATGPTPANAALDAGTALILDRASGQLTLLVLVLPILPLWWQPLRATWREISPKPGLCAALIASLLALTILGLCSYFWRSAMRYIARARGVFFRPRALAVHLAYSVFSVVLLGGAFFCAARSLGFALPLGLALRVVPLVLVASTLPSFAFGTGAREAATAALYHALGLHAAEGAAVALSLGLLGFVATVPALLVLAVTRLRARDSSLAGRRT